MTKLVNHMKNLFFLLFFLTFQLFSQNNPKFFDMPTAQKVLNQVKGKDKAETYIQQCATLSHLSRIALYRMSDFEELEDNVLMAAKKKQNEEYNTFYKEVRQRYSNEIKSLELDENAKDWDATISNFSNNEEFQKNIINILFNERAKNQYNNVFSRREQHNKKLKDTNAKKQKEKSNAIFNNIIAHGFFWIVMFSFLIFGVILTIRGYNWRKRLLKYEFENTTSGGVVGFDDFGKAQKHSSNKTFSGILIFIGVVIFMIALLLINITIVNDKLF
tara:strand:- start:91580 stop:92401 length:822 start_codon:yes stop_codon:yes gene_type:complete